MAEPSFSSNDPLRPSLANHVSISYRRLALSFIGVVVTAVFITGIWLNRVSCRASGACFWPITLGVTVVAVGAVVWLAWRWGSWYAQQSTLAMTGLEGEFRRQVRLVGLERTRLATVLQQMPDGVLLTNDIGQIQLMNSAARRLLHVRDEDALGRSFAEIAYHHELIDLWQVSREEQAEKTATLELLRREAFLQVVISPIRADGGIGSLVILQDLTKIRRLETIRRDFISNVSHELLTPIAAMRALVETLQDGAVDDPVMSQKFLGRAQIEVDTISQIVSELLMLSRIESGQVNLRLKPTGIIDLVLQPAERLRSPAQRRDLSLVLDIPAALPQVWADAEQVSTVLTNLIHNAIKYTPSGGKITISAKAEEIIELPDGLEAQNMVVITIKDTGIGISKEDLPRVFERFYKGDRSRQRIKAGGTGLGLSIAKHIVQAHEGHIWVKSKEHKGAHFYVALPAVEAEQE